MAHNIEHIKLAHIGLPKTASTFLQRHYFPKITGQFFSTEAPFIWPPELRFVFDGNALWYQDLIAGKGVLSPNLRRSEYSQLIQKKMNKWMNSVTTTFNSSAQSEPCILSSEGLYGLSIEVNSVHMSLLKAAGVNKVLFIYRQQASWALSIWRQFLLAENRFARFVPFETLFGTSEGEGVINLDWNLYVQAMDAEFGSENVLVLPYELLVSDPTSFFLRLNKFIGIAEAAFNPDPSVRENPSRTDRIYRGLTIDNHFPLNLLPKIRHKLHRLVNRHPNFIPRFILEEHPLSIDDKILKGLKRRFATANERLEKRTKDINLKDYGYY